MRRDRLGQGMIRGNETAACLSRTDLIDNEVAVPGQTWMMMMEQIAENGIEKHFAHLHM